jgi:hypothetical protein
MASNTLRAPPKVAGEEEAFKRAQKAARPRWKSEYKGPDPDRQKIDGKAVVSREELADFRKRFGAEKTLGDLLNADRTGKLPTPVNAAPAGPRRKPESDPTPMLERMKGREARGERVLSNEEERDRAKERTMTALGMMPMAAGAGMAARATLGRTAGREAAKRVEPLLDTSRGAAGKFRSGAPSVRAAQREAAEEMAKEPMLKRGGATKAYAKGGSVRGGGCETRTKKTRYV